MRMMPSLVADRSSFDTRHWLSLVCVAQNSVARVVDANSVHWCPEHGASGVGGDGGGGEGSGEGGGEDGGGEGGGGSGGECGGGDGHD